MREDSPEARRQAAADARAEGRSYRDAGAAAGVAHTTVLRWEQEPVFRARVEAQREQLLDALARVATLGMARAAAALEADEYTPSEAARVAGIAATNYGRILATMPKAEIAEPDEYTPLTDDELERVRRLVLGMGSPS
jgi:hypothetical protein